MTKTSVLHMRLKPEVKSEADRILDRLGMTTAEAVNIFLHQVILHGGIPFEISAPRFNSQTEQAFIDSEEGRNLNRFKTADEMFAALDKV